MTYQQLIVQVADNTSYTRREIRKILRLVSSAVINELAGGGEVSWRGLGAFKNVPRKSHYVRNVFTGKMYWTEPSRRVRFVSSLKLRKKVIESTKIFVEPDLAKRYLPKETQGGQSGKVRSTDRS